MSTPPDSLDVDAIHWNGAQGAKQSADAGDEARKRQAAAIARAEFIAKYGKPPEEMQAPMAAPGDLKKTGDEYLATLEPGLAAQVRQLAEGRRAFPTGAALRDPNTKMLLAAATQYDPTLDAANAATRMQTRKDFTSGMSARNLTALNTAIGHLATLKKMALALNNTGSPDINAIVNSVQSKHLGDPRVNNFNTVRDAFATELAKVFKGQGAPSLTEIQDWQKRAQADQSPEQMAGFVAQAADLLSSRINAVGDTYNRGMGKSSDPVELLSPHARELYGALTQPEVEKPKVDTRDVFDAPKPGEHVSGEDVKGYRFTPEQERALTAYARDPAFKPEHFATMVAGFMKDRGAPTDDATLADAAKQGAALHEAYVADPNAPDAQQDYSRVDKAASENAGITDTVSQTLRNLPESAANLASGVLSPATDAIKSIGTGKREGLYKAVPDIATDFAGLTNTGTADAVWASLKDRYGAAANAKRSLIRDPVGVLGDASLALTGGGSALARAPGVLGRTGEAAQLLGRKLDPLAVLHSAATEQPGRILAAMPEGRREMPGQMVSETAAFPSGVGGNTLREAYAAGRTRAPFAPQTPQSRAFTTNMRNGADNAGSAVDVAMQAMGNLRRQASDAYTRAMANFGRNPVPLPADDLRITMAALKPPLFDDLLAAPNRPADHLSWEKMNDTVEHYLAQAQQNPRLLEPLALDQFKQGLRDIGSKINGAPDGNAARIARTASNAVRELLTNHDPVYGDIMLNYGGAMDEIADFADSFGLKMGKDGHLNTDRAARKLQSSLRNNANTNYGAREARVRALAELDRSGTLMPTLAGQAASSWTPRGVRVAEAALPAYAVSQHGLGALFSPYAATAAAIASPRVMGELAHGAGRAMAGAAKVADKADDLYRRYPTPALALSRADEYSDDEAQAMKRADRDALLRRYMSAPLPGVGQ